MINPMDSLPRYGAILKKFKLSTRDEDRCGGDLIAACLDYNLRQAWSYLGLWPKEEEKHRGGMSIMEVQEFLDWAMYHLLEDMEMGWEKEMEDATAAVEEFMNQCDEEEDSHE